MPVFWQENCSCVLIGRAIWKPRLTEKKRLRNNQVIRGCTKDHLLRGKQDNSQRRLPLLCRMIMTREGRSGRYSAATVLCLAMEIKVPRSVFGHAQTST